MKQKIMEYDIYDDEIVVICLMIIILMIRIPLLSCVHCIYAITIMSRKSEKVPLAATCELWLN